MKLKYHLWIQEGRWVCYRDDSRNQAGFYKVLEVMRGPRGEIDESTKVLLCNGERQITTQVQHCT